MSITPRLRALLSRTDDDASRWQTVRGLIPSAVSSEEALLCGAAILDTAVGGRSIADGIQGLIHLRSLASVAGDPTTMRSLWRAEGILRRCLHDDDSVARNHGISDASEEGRYSGALALALSKLGRHGPAAEALSRAIDIISALNEDHPLRQQTALITQRIQGLIEGPTQELQALQVVTSAAMLGCIPDKPGAARRNALILAGNALMAGNQVGEAQSLLTAILTLDDTLDAGPAERCRTAILAYRIHTARGETDQAQRAAEAARDFARRAPAMADAVRRSIG